MIIIINIINMFITVIVIDSTIITTVIISVPLGFILARTPRSLARKAFTSSDLLLALLLPGSC